MNRLHCMLTAATFVAMAGASTIAHAMGNPASAFCNEMGGRSETATLKSGDEIGLCYLPGKKVVEEWTLFHMFDGKVPSDDDNPFLD
ncbi:UNVERIFIED_ORG: putative hemolysin [Agrobacterium larrymoorei]|uniref:DUF333 domain-containing protein n=2 Tax=Rhizobium/Agrobacterium group TaxID=227290 RepID=A0AA92BZ70_RHIRH|nr:MULTISPECIES: DUF333 domain-containing protein [Rhizobium/Agrobacterium group]MDP9573867.1 putative hemolysin [Agrobacterium larrymoorei]PVE62549.1 DUF333 domain-containing protein [Agrobacterium tumefaciens]PVE70687.1 DUF333 domain-containing protein [Sphingomonas sp. TPD3009]PVE50190.1 DUF333 domain-containing protein [Rhizobium rhizogenes]TBN14849.1 DUF333 domain-containing protein [Agrobacterium cavarae]